MLTDEFLRTVDPGLNEYANYQRYSTSKWQANISKNGNTNNLISFIT